MTSVQERLQLKRIALDKWTTREQLCLASAVSCSGDQNWMSVSRSLKVLCGANRPADWFSQKSCAVQYGELLENVETPKRKKRTTNERDTQIAETPTESILRKLTEERINELRSVIQAEQQEYAKLREEILFIQSEEITETQVREMWAEIEKEMEQKQIEKQKHEQWLKEREERKNELQKTSRLNMFQSGGSTQVKPTNLNLTVKPEDVDTDDSASKQGTSPLLTSLLKSPATTPTASNSPTSVRVTAPTITNLLTGNTNSAVSVNTSSSGQGFQLIQNQPLTGPVPSETTPPVIQSPSQAAPTLSMLLENKNANKQPTNNEQKPVEIKMEENSNEPEAMETEEGSCSPNKEEVQQLMEVFKGLIPDNIDEDIEEILTNNNGIILNSELLEEESILENVDSLIDDQEDMSDSSKNKAIDEQTPMQVETSKNMLASTDSIEMKNRNKDEKNEAGEVKIKPTIEDSSGGGCNTDKEANDVVQDSKILKTDEAEEEGLSNNVDGNDEKSDVQLTSTTEEKNKESQKKNSTDSESKVVDNSPANTSTASKEDCKSEKESTVDTVKKEEQTIDQRTISPIRKEHTSPEKRRDNETSREAIDKYNIENEKTLSVETSNEATAVGSIQDQTTTITIIDTDEDTTMEVIKEDKIGKAKRDYSRKKAEPIERRLEDIDENRLSISLRKLKERDGSESPLVDDETSDSIPRTRRRYSSTPNIDSIPSSPASSDDREYKVWKKSVLTVYNKICSHKYASMFLKGIPEESGPHYKQIVLKPMDLQTIKHNIEYGIIRTTAEFQRDVLLMLHNAIMYYSKDNSSYAMAKEMVADVAVSIESMVENAKKELDQRSGICSKNRGRKSTRLP